jgi:hypothetical protein
MGIGGLADDEEDVRRIARLSPWFPVTARADIMLAWSRAVRLIAITPEYQERLYYTTSLDNFSARSTEDEDLFFERMGVSSWNSVIGGLNEGGKRHGLVFVADIDLHRIGAPMKAIRPSADLCDLHRGGTGKNC